MVPLLSEAYLFELLHLKVEELNLPEKVSVNSRNLYILLLEFSVLFEDLPVFLIKNILAHFELFAPNFISLASFTYFLYIFL